ncbi:MAG: glycosyltransferase [Vicinamibacterales bacterium]
MQILWLKSDLLLPLDKGGKLRTWHLMRYLAREHRITYLAFAEPDVSAASIEGMHEVAAEIVTIPRRDPVKRSPAFFADVLYRLLDPLPYAVGKYRSRAYRAAIERLLRTRDFNLIVCDFLPPAVNLPSRLPCPAVLFTHNVESDIWRRHAETARGPLAAVYRSQWRRMSRFEGRALARFDRVLVVSDADRDTFARLYPETRTRPVDVVATGVDTSYFAPAQSPPSSRELVFTGSMDWLPNEDAMLHFCRTILPLVRAEEPDTRLTIVGRAPTPPVRRLAGTGVTVTGRVEDVRPYLDAAAVVVVPLRIGGGTRLKIFEAMAMGKAVVSTTVGAEGLPVTHDRDLLLADDPPAFAAAVVQLLRDVPRRRAMEAAARAHVVARHDWAVVSRDLDAALRAAADGASRSRSTGTTAPREANRIPSSVANSATPRGL